MSVCQNYKEIKRSLFSSQVMLSARESEGESHLEVELPVIIGTIPLRRSYGMVNKLIPATRLTRSYSGECKTFVTIKRGKMLCILAFVSITYTLLVVQCLKRSCATN